MFILAQDTTDQAVRSHHGLNLPSAETVVAIGIIVFFVFFGLVFLIKNIHRNNIKDLPPKDD